MDAKNEWEIFVIYMIQNCKMKDVLVLLASNDTLKTMYPNSINLFSSPCFHGRLRERIFNNEIIKTCLRSVMKTQTQTV